jgi:WS/DGAT/MGAT family acyltransferase
MPATNRGIAAPIRTWRLHIFLSYPDISGECHMQQLNVQDAGFLYQETGNTPMHLCGMALYDQAGCKRKRQSKEQIIAYIEDRIHHCPIMMQKLMMAPGDLERPYWVEDENFAVKNHLHHLALPAPGNRQQLLDLVSEIMSSPLDLSRPLWELYVIEGLNQVDGVGKNSFALVNKVHHCCIDGSGGNNIMAALSDLSPDALPIPPGDTKQPRPEREHPGTIQMMAGAYWRGVKNTYRGTMATGSRLPALARVATDLYHGDREAGANLSVPATRFNKTPGKGRVFSFLCLDLSAVKAIKAAHQDITVNDVMVSVVGGAMRHYFKAHNEPVDGCLGASIPKDIRKGEESNNKGGNKVGGLFIRIHNDIAGPLKRLKAVHASVIQANMFSKDIDLDSIFPNLLGGFMPPRAGKALTRFLQQHRVMERMGPTVLNTIITNVVGPDFPLYHAGAEMVSCAGIPPLLDSVGLVHAVYSCNGAITLSVTSCPQMMDDPEFYIECCQRAFDELKEATDRM